MATEITFKVDDSVVVKPNVKDPDSGADIGGWQGRVKEIDSETDLVCIAWDSVTLRNTPASAIAESEEEGLDWTQMYLNSSDVELVSSMDTEADVADVVERLTKEHAWDDLGAEGRRIHAVLADVDPDDEWAAMEAWKEHLGKVLDLPFEGEVAECQEKGPLREGYRVIIRGIEDVDDMYGVLVDVRLGQSKYVFPLCDLKTTDKSSPNHHPVQDYATWFANR